MRFAGILFYETEEGERRRLADFDVEAADAAAAEKLVIDQFWDQRLDSASCVPIIKLGAQRGVADVCDKEIPESWREPIANRR